MKKQNIIIITILIMLILIAVGYLIYVNLPKPKSTQEPMVGNDRDAHGCIGSAGYSWCEPKQKCLRIWEEDCA